jgi:hypothetical protein
MHELFTTSAFVLLLARAHWLTMQQDTKTDSPSLSQQQKDSHYSSNRNPVELK